MFLFLFQQKTSPCPAINVGASDKQATSRTCASVDAGCNDINLNSCEDSHIRHPSTNTPDSPCSGITILSDDSAIIWTREKNDGPPSSLNEQAGELNKNNQNSIGRQHIRHRIWNLLTSKLRQTASKPSEAEHGEGLFRCDTLCYMCNQRSQKQHHHHQSDNGYLVLSPPVNREGLSADTTEINYLRRTQREAHEAALHARHAAEKNVQPLKRSGAIKKKCVYDMRYRDAEQRIIWAQRKGKGKVVTLSAQLALDFVMSSTYDDGDESDASDGSEATLLASRDEEQRIMWANTYKLGLGLGFGKGKSKAVETPGDLGQGIGTGSGSGPDADGGDCQRNGLRVSFAPPVSVYLKDGICERGMRRNAGVNIPTGKRSLASSDLSPWWI